MAAVAVLQRLKMRADQAEQIIAQLRAQLVVVRQHTVGAACQQEEVKLSEENDRLRQEVEQLREQLVQAETRNGVPQVAMPSRGKAKMSGASNQLPAHAAAPEEQSPTPAKEPPKKQAKKEKKENKAGGNKPKAQAAGADKAVDVSRLNMRVGHIVSAKRHPDADGLYIEDVDLGEEKTRTIISGLVKHIPLEQMQDRLAIFLTNLKPVKMRGIMSEGMIMCASTPDKVEIIDPPQAAQIGDKITVEGFNETPDDQLNPKKKIWESVAPDLKVNEEGLATYKGVVWKIGDKGTCKAPSLTNAPIK